MNVKELLGELAGSSRLRIWGWDILLGRLLVFLLVAFVLIFGILLFSASPVGAAPSSFDLIYPEKGEIVTDNVIILQWESAGPSPESLGSDFLKTDGTVIRDNAGTGNVVQLCGVNMGGWEIMEPWMSPLEGESNEFDMRDTLDNRFGESDRWKLLNTFHNSFLKENDFQRIRDEGLNVIRLPIYYNNHMDKNGNWYPWAFDRLDWFVSTARKHGLYTILDLHGAPGSQNSAHHSGREDGALLYENSTYRDMYVKFWKGLAKHFRGNPAVAGYDLLNEPSADFPNSSGPEVTEMMRRGYDAIRSVDSNHMIFINYCWRPKVFPNPSDEGWRNVVYEGHYYDVPIVYSVLFGDFRDLYDVPYYIGEFHYGDYDTYHKAMSTFVDNGIHWTTWTYKVSGKDSSWGMYTHNNAEAYTPDVTSESYENIKNKWSNWDTENNFSRNSTVCDAMKEATSNITLHRPNYTGENTENIDYYEVWLDYGDTGSYKNIDNVSAGATNYKISELPVDNYSWYVIAVDKDNKTTQSINIYDFEITKGRKELTVPTNLSSPKQTESTIELKWSHEEEWTSHYNVYIDNDLAREPLLTKTTIKNLKPDTTYEIYVTAKNKEGVETGPSNSIHVKTEEVPEQQPYFDEPLVLPGRIQAQHFDKGGQGVAYYDRTEQNEGGAYRDDEFVDIETVDDKTGGRYNVGWIEGGEWIEYTFHVQKTGLYNFNLRVASSEDGGSVTLLLDNDEIGTIDVSGTGGWQEWDTVTLENVKLQSGKQILRLEMGGDFNINWMEFVSVDEEGLKELPWIWIGGGLALVLAFIFVIFFKAETLNIT